MVGSYQGRVNVLTLNCWGIPLPPPFGSRDRRARIAAIARELSSGRYDLVSLQEVWSESDFCHIRNIVQPILPYSFYFYNGFGGSGVCVFSKVRIEETLIHRYSLNGYAHHVHRGDWFGGKMVGLCVVNLEGVRINFYTTHTHAEYDRDNDLYLPHRVVQAFELGQFIKATLNACDLAILAGDLNWEPSDIGYKIILAYGGWQDAWCQRQSKFTPEITCPVGSTCDLPNNEYTGIWTKKRCPQGKRIDYILYNRLNEAVNCTVEQCYPTLDRFEAAGRSLNFSDHMAVFASFFVEKHADNFSMMRTESCPAELDNALPIIERGIEKVKTDRRFFLVLLAASFVVYLWTIQLELHWPGLAMPIIISRFSLTLLMGFFLWYGLVCLKSEESSLKATKASLQLLIDNRCSSN